jgi:hypothetical protein
VDDQRLAGRIGWAVSDQPNMLRPVMQMLASLFLSCPLFPLFCHLLSILHTMEDLVFTA